MIKSKEEIKLKIPKIFTKIRNLLNEREDQLLLDLDNMYDKLYFKEEIIKKGEKIPNKIKNYLEKGTILNNEWEKDNKLISNINDCINIENNIKSIVEINENIEKCNKNKFKIKFKHENQEITELEKNIKIFGEIINEEDEVFKFKFQPGDKYDISNNGLIATKNKGNDNWNCVILGNKKIPKDRISKWKIKINENKKYSSNLDIVIGIGPNVFKHNLYDECWSIVSDSGNVIKLLLKKESLYYNNHKEKLKKGDIIEVIVDRKNGNLSFAVNDVNYGIACSTIPKEDELYPTIVLFEQGLSVEIV